MKLWLISQGENNGYDTYDSAVVAAETEQLAKETSPSDYYTFRDGLWRFDTVRGLDETGNIDQSGSWAHPDKVDIEYIGEATEGTEAGVICASFNAG
jgi:hypothetical protein